MTDYVFLADLLNKYSQLTPWVQAIISLSFFGMIIGIAYFIKESIALLTGIFYKQKPIVEERKWKDS